MHEGRPVYLIDGNRTPFLKAGSGPGPFSASDLAMAAGKPLLLRQNFAADELDEVILGCAAPSPDEANIGRVSSLRLGCQKSTPAWTVMRNCASGMQALDSAATNIALGRSDLVLAGGTEAMSHTAVLFSNDFVSLLGAWNSARNFQARLKVIKRFRPAMLTPIIGLLRGLTDPVVGMSMGQTTEKIAHRFGISRHEMDEFAARSQQRLAEATDNEAFAEEMTPIMDSKGNAYTSDSGLRRDSTVEKLAKLRPVFDRPAGNVTAGNSAQITDGATWLILASEDAVKRHKLKPFARLVDSQWAGLDPSEMGLGPVYASTPILKRNRLKLDDVDYWEINEAFAGQVLGCLRAWESEQYCREFLQREDAVGRLDQDRLNLHGGGISQGHPVGASGARIVLHAARVLQQTKQQRAIATLCIGGGQGGAMLIERVEA